MTTWRSSEDGGEDVPWPEGRLGEQLRFLLGVDRLKSVLRQTRIADGTRTENSAEHSWQLALFALVLAEHAPHPVDVSKVISMLLVHDLVEVDAGDTFIYDERGLATKQARERAAADRIFGILPDDQGRRFRELWEEFEERVTPDARFAGAMDRLAPLLLNFVNCGHSWRHHSVPAGRVRAVNGRVADAFPELGVFAQTLITEAVARGWLSEDPPPDGVTRRP